jgi:hypothetical protein
MLMMATLQTILPAFVWMLTLVSTQEQTCLQTLLHQQRQQQRPLCNSASQQDMQLLTAPAMPWQHLQPLLLEAQTAAAPAPQPGMLLVQAPQLQALLRNPAIQPQQRQPLVLQPQHRCWPSKLLHLQQQYQALTGQRHHQPQLLLPLPLLHLPAQRHLSMQQQLLSSNPHPR